MKEALDQFRGVFDLLQASHSTVQQELDRARADVRDQVNAALRPLLLDVIDLRDRLVAALKMSASVRPRWTDRLLRREVSGGEAWQEGLRITLRRLDQVLLDRRVVPTSSDRASVRSAGGAGCRDIAGPVGAGRNRNRGSPSGVCLGRAGFADGRGYCEQRRRERRTHMTDEIVGIDLGTTNSEIAIYHDGRPRGAGR